MVKISKEFSVCLDEISDGLWGRAGSLVMRGLCLRI